MHGICAGVVRHFLNLWINVPGPWNIKAHLGDMDKFVLSVKPTGDFNIIGPVSDFFNWKSSDGRYWLLVLSLPVLSMFLDAKYVQHWMLLVMAVYLLLTEKISPTDLDAADCTLKLFVRDVPKLYRGRDCVFNTHQTIHLCLYTRGLGPLWSNSAFGFENFNGILKKMIHGTRNPGKELISVLRRTHCLNVLRNKVASRRPSPPYLQVTPFNMLSSLKVLSSDDRDFLRSHDLSNAKLFKRVKYQLETFTSVLYSAEKIRNNYTVCFNLPSGEVGYGEVLCYVLLSSGQVLALISVFKVDHARVFYHADAQMKVSHIVPVSQSHDKVLCSFENISHKVVRVGSFVCKIPNKFESNL